MIRLPLATPYDLNGPSEGGVYNVSLLERSALDLLCGFWVCSIAESVAGLACPLTSASPSTPEAHYRVREQGSAGAGRWVLVLVEVERGPTVQIRLQASSCLHDPQLTRKWSFHHEVNNQAAINALIMSPQ